LLRPGTGALRVVANTVRLATRLYFAGRVMDTAT